MPPQRDPLSTHYDGIVGKLMERAKPASRQGRGMLVWIASPRAEYAHPDRGGRTAHERAFTRSAYYNIFKNGGEPGSSGYSLKLTWGEELRPSSRGRLARPVVVRLFPRGAARVSGARWVDGSGRSEPGRRIDE